MKYNVVQSPMLYPETRELKGVKYQVLDTYKNLEWLLKHFNAKIQYNLMTRRREITIPDEYIFTDDIENDSLARIDYISTINGMPNKKLDQHLNTIAGENSYHPIIKALADNPWDGIYRLDNFIKTVKAVNSELAYITIKTWMIAAIAAAYSKTGFANQGVLVLQGPQGIGKTEWVKKLDPINCGAVKEGVLLDPAQKDSIIGASRFWIVELGELDATFNKADIARLKSFITSHMDDVRFPYARCETRLIRRTAYVATVNEANFLVDTTGNRRWWTVAVTGFVENHDFDMRQVWGEVYCLWINGALTYLTRDDQLKVNEANKDHEKIDPMKEKVLEYYNWDRPGRRELSASAILEELGYSRPSKLESTNMGKILTEINQLPPRRTMTLRLHQIPYRKI